MKNIRTEETNEQREQFVKVSNVNNKPLVRVYSNLRTEEREDKVVDEKKVYTVHLADFIERVSDKTTALDLAKEEAIAQITAYDTSEAVNSFTLQGKQMWLPKETRVGIANLVTYEKKAGRETTILWYDGEKYELPVDTALQMLSTLELYASECYNVTEAHKAAVSALESVEDIVAYDYTQNYPEKLIF